MLRACHMMDSADAIDQNFVDGKTFLELEESMFLRSIDDGGLGLTLLQLKRVQKEIEVVDEEVLQFLRAST